MPHVVGPENSAKLVDGGMLPSEKSAVTQRQEGT